MEYYTRTRSRSQGRPKFGQFRIPQLHLMRSGNKKTKYVCDTMQNYLTILACSPQYKFNQGNAALASVWSPICGGLFSDAASALRGPISAEKAELRQWDAPLLRLMSAVST